MPQTNTETPMLYNSKRTNLGTSIYTLGFVTGNTGTCYYLR
jgi:hypothetical protein